MITNKVVAKEIAEVLLEVSGKLDESVARAQQACSDAEFQSYRRAVGHIMGELWDELLKPVYDLHPRFEAARCEMSALLTHVPSNFSSSGRAGSAAASSTAIAARRSTRR